MSAHDWPEFDQLMPNGKLLTEREFVGLTRAQYNYAKVRIDACAGIEDAVLNHVIDAGGWKDISAQWIQNLANANDCITRQRKELNNYIETTGSAFNRLEAQRDALQQRCEELVSALVELDNRYCDAGQYLTPDERLAHRKTLIKVRRLIAKQVQP